MEQHVGHTINYTKQWNIHRDTPRTRLDQHPTRQKHGMTKESIILRSLPLTEKTTYGTNNGAREKTIVTKMPFGAGRNLARQSS